MTLAGIELRYLVDEITKRTKEYYVNNIYGISKDSLLFKLHHPEKPDIMLMMSTFGFWISSKKIDQIETNNLLRQLRKCLLRFKLIKIEQVGAERIVYLTFSNSEEEFILIGELFGDGNIILCNKEMKILGLLHSLNVRHRQLRVGIQYSPPPQKNLNVFEITQNDIDVILESNIPIIKWIGNNLGLPAKYSEEIVALAKIDGNLPGNSLTKEDAIKIFDSVNNVINKVTKGPHVPCIINEKEKSDALPIKLSKKVIDKEITIMPSFMEALDHTFTEIILIKGRSLGAATTNKKINELEKQLEEQAKAIDIVKERTSKISDLAESLVNAQRNGVQSINDDQITQILKNKNAKIINEKGVTLIKINETKIPINLKSSIPTIVSLLFDEAKRQKSAIGTIEKNVEKTQRSLDKEQLTIETSKDSIGFSEVRKKNWFERYRWFYTSDGILAIGGRDTSSNSAVIRKHVQKNDRIFHADIFGSPFFVLKCAKETTIPPTSLNEVAYATACFSRTWREARYGVNAYWVNPEQVKKAAPSGQFLPKGSFVIEGKRNFVKVSTLSLGVGYLQEGKDYLLICGPPKAIKENCVCYVIIEPGGIEMVDVAKKIKAEFASMKEEITKPIGIDDFVRVLPAGNSHIVETGWGKEQEDG